jgi:hypothetical protein
MGNTYDLQRPAPTNSFSFSTFIFISQFCILVLDICDHNEDYPDQVDQVTRLQMAQSGTRSRYTDITKALFALKFPCPFTVHD